MDLYEQRRYLSTFTANRVPHIFTDVLVIGGGIAGLRAAIEASRYGDVLVVTKSGPFRSNTAFAQGGIAVVFSDDDSCEQHIADTLQVACGLGDYGPIDTLIRRGPAEVKELLDWGARFDRDSDGKLCRGREAGHGLSRVLHADGDATGHEIAETLIHRAIEAPRIRVFYQCFTIDLVTLDDVCCGAITYHPKYGHQLVWAKQTILASGGAGRLFRETTNPEIATADGTAMAYRTGAVLRDMEMVQFHPTTMYVAGATRTLISEAVRGEGAYLVDRQGRRFMTDYHPDAELAPRDVVSRAILTEMSRTKSPCVFLDVRHIPRDRFAKRFPSIYERCRQFDMDVAHEFIPVRPSAHYMIGGLVVDQDTRTTVPGLLACGEVACTGVHGANRLASNSLLEGLVFGAIAGRAAGESLAHWSANGHPSLISTATTKARRVELDLEDIRNSLRALMTRSVGIEREMQRLDEAIHDIDFWGRYVMDKTFDKPYDWESQNMLTVARLIALAARNRTESRGVHHRTDFPNTDDQRWRVHVTLRRGDEGPVLGTNPVDEAPA
ncbi:MAG: L-aspartate oxidase [Phycisphaerae bacterium]|nr:L-aspartate oxidase [Phycisphaerae bacterium]